MQNLIRFFLSLLILCLPQWVSFTAMVMALNTTIPVNVGLVIDSDTVVGKRGLTSIQMALSDFYYSHHHYKTRLVLHTRDAKQDIVGAAAAALDLIKNVQVQAIIGPDSSMQTEFIIDIGDKAQVPIISFSATSASLSSIQSLYFIRATQNDLSQVKAISAIIQAFGWREAVPIYVDNEYGEGIIPSLTDALQENDIRIPYRSVIQSSATDDQIVRELDKLMRMQTRIFIVHMLPSLGSRLFIKAKELGMMSEGFVWILTDGFGNLLSYRDPSVTDSMQGVLGLKTYIPHTTELEEFSVQWKRKFQHDNPTTINTELSIFELRAFDATVALAMAIEKVGAKNFGFQKMNNSGNSTDLETFGVSQLGLELCQAFSSTRFKGLAGDFHMVDGQLQPSAFQIFNVIGNGERGVGFWTPGNGISRRLNFTNTKAYSTSKANLGIVIWPGEPTYVPSWVKKLRIGVPVKEGFSEFVKVTRNHSSNTLVITGYCIDVFNAVMEALPYNVHYDFIPFENSSGKRSGTYNDLISQVYIQQYDAVVGDVTINANRSLYVDFTLPYTVSGVSMIVPIKGNNRKNTWVFLKPLTWGLWVTSTCFFIFTGFVIWVLEHRINEDFRGPPSHQVGMIFWFSFSTMVFAHKEKVVSNLARFVVIIWVFVVLILTLSYTASYTTMLTVEQLQPSVTDTSELFKRGEYVGYGRGSFVFELLKQMGFDETKLRAYVSPEELHDAFSKGSKKGGIAAAFDEIPYLKLFLAKYCLKYSIVGQPLKTDGFGFVFPRGSPLVTDVSRAILNVFEGEKMEKIEKKWFAHQTGCLRATEPSTNLGFDSFWGLFLIATVASSLSFIIYIAMFLYEHWPVLMQFEVANLSPWRKFKVMLRHFDQKDLNSHTFKKSGVPDNSVINGMGVVEVSQTNYPPPSPSTEYGDPSPNRQTYQEIVPATELTDPNRERSIALEIAHVNN